MPGRFAPAPKPGRKDGVDRFLPRLLDEGAGVDDDDIGVVDPVPAGELLGWSWLAPPYRAQFDARALEKLLSPFFSTRAR